MNSGIRKRYSLLACGDLTSLCNELKKSGQIIMKKSSLNFSSILKTIFQNCAIINKLGKVYRFAIIKASISFIIGDKRWGK